MTDRYGIVGHPVAHSLSPAMHNAAFRALGIEASYEVIDLEPEGFEEGFRALAERGFRGVNVTVPHKESVLSLVDELDPVAKAIGAVNTITFEPLGIAGTNTDADGLARSLEEASVSLAGSKVVVLGAGGAARAAVYGVGIRGSERVTVLARNPAQSEALASSLTAALPCAVEHGSLDEHAKDAFADADLVIQATSATLDRSGDAVVFACSLPFDALPESAVVCDLVYRPRETAVLKAAAARGLRTVDGLGMLLHQATLAFERWTGKVAPIDVMRHALETAL